MGFAQPLLLVALLAVPVLLGAYVWQLRRRRRVAVRYSSIALVRAAAGPVRSWRRHVPVGLVLASLALLGLAAARPQVRADVPVSSSTVVIALDVSGSMCATDVQPNRLAAAQQAVRGFVQAQDEQTKVGLVLFSGFSQLAVAPTTDRDDLVAALDGVTTGRGTTIGSAILTSIDAIAELDPGVQRSDPVDAAGAAGAGALSPTPAPSSTRPATDPGAPGGGPGGPASSPGGLAPEIVVLLTDGANTRGVTPQQAAQQAAERGVRVYPIGFGTKNPTQLVCSRDQLGDASPRFGRGDTSQRYTDAGGRNYLVVDEPALRVVAQTTQAQYFSATDADQLTSVLRDLPRHVTVQQQDVDLSAWFALAAAALLVGGLALSLRWSTLS
ncbi:Ca-activated chloride channel family protein [Terracoccus luteus]|uniref:Ca-activated chloride channel family protein n=1 Tax=Terracoccus luteus TaxID=53356 RepID=A0A495Y361_9MICO|nr:VWA domain-containing protein [Terracoccus luteus]RKT79473.1 Ca-activated chloride channel family protein [Terracoccus luteus]